jgi:predicted lipoprotein with Yx(FWY)xxD motif
VPYARRRIVRHDAVHRCASSRGSSPQTQEETMYTIRSTSCAIAIATMLGACSAPGDRAVDTSSSPGTIDDAPASASAPAPAPTPATGATGATAGGSVGTASATGVGRYLTDANGRALYMFERDTKNTSACNVADGCAVAWPPFSIATPTSTDASVQAGMLDVITRADARTQATYDGMPLYYYEDDKKPGDIEGQGKLEFGGLWYLVSPSGQEIKTSGKGRS